MFLAAAVFGAAAVPAWLYLRQCGYTAASADWHGHELLFGYVLAVVGGFLTGPVSRRAAVGLGVAWLVARVSALVEPFGTVHATATATFAVGLAGLSAPKLLRGPSQPRNRVLGPVVVAILAMAVLTPFAQAHRTRLLLVVIDLYAILITFMGGRLIAAAAAGAYYRSGRQLDARVQPRLEATVFMVLLLLAVSDLVRAPALVTSAIAIVAAGLSLARWLRWRLWTCLGSWSLSALGAGYLWLAVGLGLRALRQHPLWVLPTDALHGLTIGAIGALTLLVMGRTQAMTTGVRPERSHRLLLIAIFVNAATGLRLMAGLTRCLPRTYLLQAAVVAWSSACLVLVWFLLSLPEASRGQKHNGDAGSHDGHDIPNPT